MDNYFPDIMKLRFAFFYSRGDLEPYVMLDDEFTTQLYGSTYNPKRSLSLYYGGRASKPGSGPLSQGLLLIFHVLL